MTDLGAQSSSRALTRAASRIPTLRCAFSADLDGLDCLARPAVPGTDARYGLFIAQVVWVL